MWIIIIIVAVIFLLAGLGRALYKGQYNSLRNFLITMLFLDIVLDDWSGDSDLGYRYLKVTGSAFTTRKPSVTWVVQVVSFNLPIESFNE